MYDTDKKEKQNWKKEKTNFKVDHWKQDDVVHGRRGK